LLSFLAFDAKKWICTFSTIQVNQIFKLNKENCIFSGLRDHLPFCSPLAWPLTHVSLTTNPVQSICFKRGYSFSSCPYLNSCKLYILSICEVPNTPCFENYMSWISGPTSLDRRKSEDKCLKSLCSFLLYIGLCKFWLGPNLGRRQDRRICTPEESFTHSNEMRRQ
jgi:hypothetical protein